MPSRGRRRRQQSSAADAVLSRPLAPLFSGLPSLTPLKDVEDRRTWHPVGPFRPARQLGGHPVHPVNVNKPKNQKFKRQLPFGLKFAVPENTVICVRRKRRKEVLHALKKTGKGRGRKRPTKNWYSKIGC